MTRNLKRGEFIASVSLRSRLLLFGFIFFLFAPASILLISRFEAKRSFACLATYAVFGGLTAAGWAYAFLRNRLIFYILIPSQVLWVFIPQWFAADFRTGFTPSLEGAACIALIVTGYVMFVVFFRTEGMKAIRMQTELALAQQIHASLIPPIDRRVGHLELFGRSEASAEMGGDLLDVITHDGGTDVLIADVSGHGVKAGVVMAVVKSAIRTRLRSGVELGGVFRDVNDVVCELAGRGMFVTAACLRFSADGAVEFVGAGHGAVLHYQANHGEVATIESDHLPLGVQAGEAYQPVKVSCLPSDVLLLMTDGLTEVFNARGLMFGQEAIGRLLAERARLPLAELYAAVMSAVRNHGPQSDDQTLMLVRIRESR